MKKDDAILIVEDELVDLMVAQRAFRQLNVKNPIVTAGDGEEALSYLLTSAPDGPGLVLLDLKMPKLSGLELLHMIKQDARLKTIPVVVITASDEARDKQASFGLGAAGYMIKSQDYEAMVETFAIIHAYWTTSELAHKEVMS